MDEGAREGKKRKHGNEDHQEEENEEEKMEKFFALIRSTREARDRLQSGGLSIISESERPPSLQNEIDINRELEAEPAEDHHHRHPRREAWYPTFQPEDFGVGVDPKSNTVFAAAAAGTTLGTDVSANAGPSSSGHDHRHHHHEAGPSESAKPAGGEGDDGNAAGKKEKDGNNDDGGLNLKLSL